MVNTLTSFPNLPLIPFPLAKAFLLDHGINLSEIARMSGLSRQALWLSKKSAPGQQATELISMAAYRLAIWLKKTGKSKAPDQAHIAIRHDAKALANADISVLPNELRAKVEAHYAAA